eukprot:109271-Amphidinium_carterae.1
MVLDRGHLLQRQRGGPLHPHLLMWRQSRVPRVTKDARAPCACNRLSFRSCWACVVPSLFGGRDWNGGEWDE